MRELIRLDLGSLGKLNEGTVQEQFDAGLESLLVRFNDDNVKRDKDGVVTGSITITVSLSQFQRNAELSASIDVSTKEPGLRQSRSTLPMIDGRICVDVTPNAQQPLKLFGGP